MDEYLIPQLSQTLQDFKTYFLNQSYSLTKVVKTAQRFTQMDRSQFDKVLAEIKEFAMNKITHFINTRIETKSRTFIEYFEGYEENTENLKKDLESFRKDIEQQARHLKRREEQGQQLLEKISEKYHITQAMRKAFRAFKMNTQENLQFRKLNIKASNMYQTRLKSRSFFPWRALTYKDGYQNSVKRQNMSQLRKVHFQFGNIVTTLKQKILQTEQLIKTKRAAKSQFAYGLSKNLLKTISNLSIEVMSLNQITTNNKQSQKQTQIFLNEIKQTINTRIQKATSYRQTFEEINNPQTRLKSPRMSSKKEILNKASSPKPKEKRISFV